MPADSRIYNSDRLARFYAQSRPPVHDAICTKLFAALPQGCEVWSALDIGCGAGASTAALARRAMHVTGIDPYLPMLRQARRRLPSATFIQAKADALPAGASSMDLITAAGSLNYTEIDSSLAEVARVLAPNGHLAVYDFSTGRVLPRDVESETRFLSFEHRFPWPAGYALDLARLSYAVHGLALVAIDEFVIEIDMSFDAYLEYVLGETNVEAAVSGGLSEPAARCACAEIFEPLFASGPRTVGFSSVLALARNDNARPNPVE